MKTTGFYLFLSRKQFYLPTAAQETTLKNARGGMSSQNRW